MTDENTRVEAAPASATSQPAAAKARSGGASGKAGKKVRTFKKGTVRARQGATKAKRSARPGTGRTGTKQAKLIAMLRAVDGTTVEQAAKAFGWQPHTVRGAIYGSLKKAGLNVVSEKTEDRGRVYRIAD